MLTEYEAARLLRFSLPTLRRERRLRRIAFHEFGKRIIRYDPVDIVAYKRSRRVEAKEIIRTPHAKPEPDAIALRPRVGARDARSARVKSSKASAMSDRQAAQQILSRKKASGDG